MQRATARNLERQYRAAGFAEVQIVREIDRGENEFGVGVDLPGWVLTGLGRVGPQSSLQRFTIRSPRMAAAFLKDYAHFQRAQG